MSQSKDPTRRFMSLYAANQRRIYGFIRALVHDPSDTDDLVQQTLGAMWDNFAAFDTAGSAEDFAKWAMATARIEVLRFMRSRGRHLATFGQDLTDQLADTVEKMAGNEDARLEALRSTRRIGPCA